MFKAKRVVYILFIIFITVLYGCSGNSDSSVSSGDNSDIYYNINFIGGEGASGSMNTVTVKAGETTYLPANTFVKDGYEFAGWSETADGSVAYYDKSSITVNSHITLYAVWQDADTSIYTITYKSNGGTGSDIIHNIPDGADYIIQTFDFIKEGYVFTGWSDTADGIAVYHAGDTITVNQNITLYAVWEEIGSEVYYTVEFVNNGGSGSPFSEQVKAGSSYILPSNNFTNTGYTFKGWSDKNVSGQIYQPNESVIINDNITFYAVWEKDQSVVTYTVTLDANGGTGDKITTNVASGNTYTLPVNNFVFNGYYFAGWSTDKDNTVEYKTGDTVVVTSDMVFYAVWTQENKKYTVTFNSNAADGISGSMPSFTECSSIGTALPENQFVRNGYIFTGWAVSAEDVISYKNMQVITCSDNIKLYAVWKEKSQDTSGDVARHKIFFNGNGGEGTMGSMEMYDNEAVKINKNIFTRNGYIFAGWSTLLNNVVEYLDEGKIQINESVTLYAVWNKRVVQEENTVKVTLDPFGTGQDTDVYYVEKNKPFYFPYNNAVNSNKVFAGWSKTKNNQTVDYQEGFYGYFNDDTAVTLYGVWKNADEVYKIELDCNGGMPINMPEAIYILKGSSFYVPRISCDIYNRKSLNKYALEPENTVTNIYTSGAIKTVESDLHLYALWAIDDFTLENTVGGNCEECANQTFFAKDVKVPEEKDWVFKENRITKTVKWENGVNWFHVYQSSYNLCWAATASNAFHWWNIVNDKYIQAYYKYKEEKQEAVTKPDLYYDAVNERNHRQSGIFYDEFSHGTVWSNSGNQPSIGFIWLVNGLSEKEKGGYFKEIFEKSGSYISTAHSAVGKKNFNEIVTNVIKEQKGIIGIGTTTTGPHAITLWGVTYDKDGYVNGVYTSDSAISGKTADGQWGGMEYDKVIYSSSGRPYMQNDAGSLFPIESLYPMYQNEEDWIRFFEEKGISLPQ